MSLCEMLEPDNCLMDMPYPMFIIISSESSLTRIMPQMWRLCVLWLDHYCSFLDGASIPGSLHFIEALQQWPVSGVDI